MLDTWRYWNVYRLVGWIILFFSKNKKAQSYVNRNDTTAVLICTYFLFDKFVDLLNFIFVRFFLRFKTRLVIYKYIFEMVLKD